ncbi:MAG: hypothetical protein SVJ22_03390 [Halobacteriota archaeon]|nr:hypothetical protein [Halobacteriota archaeon]
MGDTEKMTCTYLAKDPMRCSLNDGGEEQYSKNKELCEGEKFSRCPWIKESMPKDQYARFQMMWGFFK